MRELGSVAFFLLGLLFIGGVIAPGIVGLYFAFKASIILGIVAIILEPSPSILGWIAFVGHSEVSAQLANWLHLPF